MHMLRAALAFSAFVLLTSHTAFAASNIQPIPLPTANSIAKSKIVKAVQAMNSQARQDNVLKFFLTLRPSSRLSRRKTSSAEGLTRMKTAVLLLLMLRRGIRTPHYPYMKLAAPPNMA
jgi:hypothetical protein